IRAWGSSTSLLVAGSMPCIPATKIKSPARAPRLQVPTALIAPGGSSVLTPLGESECAETRLVASEIALVASEIAARTRMRPKGAYAISAFAVRGAEDVALWRQHHLVEVWGEHRGGEKRDGA